MLTRAIRRAARTRRELMRLDYRLNASEGAAAASGKMVSVRTLLQHGGSPVTDRGTT